MQLEQLMLLPDAVVLYRPPWADAPTTGTKSLITVGRLAFTSAGQLGAATAMTFASRGVVPWERFWRWLGFVAGVKTLLECVGLVIPDGTPLGRALTFSTLTVVGAFLLAAGWWWRRGDLRAHPSLNGSPRVWVTASIALWAVFAVAPRFLA